MEPCGFVVQAPPTVPACLASASQETQPTIPHTELKGNENITRRRGDTEI
jgi:hypothetical protein